MLPMSLNVITNCFSFLYDFHQRMTNYSELFLHFYFCVYIPIFFICLLILLTLAAFNKSLGFRYIYMKVLIRIFEVRKIHNLF